jgi:hypothetical protein
VRGPGYVETLFTVEWSPACLDLLFSASDDAPSGLLPCNCRVSVVVSREGGFGVLSGKGFFDSTFFGSRLREESEAVLRTAKFLILPPLDFDDWILGAHRSEISRAEEFLRALEDTGAS